MIEGISDTTTFGAFLRAGNLEPHRVPPPCRVEEVEHRPESTRERPDLWPRLGEVTPVRPMAPGSPTMQQTTNQQTIVGSLVDVYA